MQQRRWRLGIVLLLGSLAAGCYPAASEAVRRDMVRSQAARQIGCSADALAVTLDRDFTYRAQGCGREALYTITCPETGCSATAHNMTPAADVDPYWTMINALLTTPQPLTRAQLELDRTPFRLW